jgi:cytochrome c oxidase cbb3-type subunit III
MSLKAVPFLMLMALAVAGCEREERSFDGPPVNREPSAQVALSPLAPGGSSPSQARDDQAKKYENNAYHLSQGKSFFKQFNCNGCHSNGGGGSGPALMDDKWIYGGEIENIVATIRDGRPNGMPSFRDKIPDNQIWEIAAYVRSMGGNVPKDAAPSRDDALTPGPPENRREQSPPKSGNIPTSAEQP